MISGPQAAALALLLGGLAACFSDRPATAPEPPAGGTSVAITNFAYVPPTLTVASGATVTWTNGDDVPHKIVSADGRFAASPVLDTNQKYAATFAAPGKYPYFCALHPRMTGTIVVQ